MDDIGWSTPAVLAGLIALSALFSACETALSSVNRVRLKSRADAGHRGAQKALELAERFERTLPAILIGNNVVNIAAASAATLIASSLFGVSGAAVSTVVMTAVILVFGEVLPKSYAKQHSEQVAIAAAPLMRLLVWLLYPLVWLLMALQEGVSRMQKTENQPLVTEEELMTIIEAIEEEGVIDEQKSELVQSALEFDDITAQEVLTPRVDLVAVEVDEPLAQVLDTVMKERFSRIPVYQGTIDEIIGILHTRDLLEAVVRGGPVELRDLLVPPLFIHKTRRLSSLLTDLQAGRLHMAVVTDDFGGTLGVVTLEDLLEQLVGEIWDEDEEAVPLMEKTGEHSFLVRGDMGIEDALEEIGYPVDNLDSEYSTMGGWALERFGRIPQAGDSFDYDGIRVKVAQMEDQRITRLELVYTPDSQ